MYTYLGCLTFILRSVSELSVISDTPNFLARKAQPSYFFAPININQTQLNGACSQVFPPLFVGTNEFPVSCLNKHVLFIQRRCFPQVYYENGSPVLAFVDYNEEFG